MKKKYRIIATLLLLALALSLAACGGKSGNNSAAQGASAGADGSKDAAKDVKLTFQIHYADEASVQLKTLRKIIEDYKSVKPNVTVEVDALNMDQQKLKLKTQAASNDMPDIFTLNPGQQMKPFVDGGKLAPLDDILAKDGLKESFQPGVLDYYSFDGKSYGLSEGNDIGLLYYNKQLLKQAGVEVPKTYEDIVEAAKKLKAAGITPLAIGEKEPWTGSMLFMNIVLRTEGPGFLKDVVAKKKKLTDPGFVLAIQKMRDLVKAGGFPEGATSFDYAQSQNMFVSGQTAMFYDGSWAAAAIEGSAIKDQVGVLAFPTVDGKGDPNQFILGPGLGYCIASNSPNMAEAKEFLHYFMTNYPKRMFDQKGGVGLAQIVNGDFKAAGYSQTAMDVLDLFKKVNGGDIAFDNTMDPSTTQTHLNGIQNLFVADINPQDLAKEHQNAFEANNP